MSDWKYGIVDWFNDVRGIGTLSDKNGNRYSFHYSTIDSAYTWKTIKRGEKVKFKVKGGRKRPVVQKIVREAIL